MSTKPPNRAFVLIDDSNIHYGCRKEGWNIDYTKFLAWLRAEFNATECYFFGGIISRKAYSDRHGHTRGFKEETAKRQRFFKKLRHLGFHVKKKPVASIYDDTAGVYRRKCNFDVEMTIIAIDHLADYDELILCSGDGDFEKLVRYIKGKHKKVTVVCHSHRLNTSLAQAANRTVYYSAIRSQIER